MKWCVVSFAGADQELEIDLDDLDWEMFDKEVNLEPVNISNSKYQSTGTARVCLHVARKQKPQNLSCSYPLCLEILMKK